MTTAMREVRCPKCNKLLFKVSWGVAGIEIMCNRCSTLVQWPGMDITPALDVAAIIVPKKGVASHSTSH